MKLPDRAVTLKELSDIAASFVSSECTKDDGHLVHKECGGAIRIGFVNLFYQNDDGSLDPGYDGFGIGPKRVPYCENCDSPDGFKHTYARRLPIKQDPIDLVAK